MNKELLLALEQIQESKGISKEVILDAIAKALEKSYEKNFQDEKNVEVVADSEAGEFHVYQIKEVVDEVNDPINEISPIKAVEYKKNAIVGDKIRIELRPKDFGRIAAQTARNIIVQKLRDAERDVLYDEYIDLKNEMIVGTVRRQDHNNVYVDLGRAEGVITAREQIPGEILRADDHVKVYVTDVRSSGKGSQVMLSRSHPQLIVRLFEQEVPEIEEGLIEIHSVAREAGSRTKIAVSSNSADIDAIGACVGYKGVRINTIVDEVGGEKMDIIIYDEDPRTFISNALSPCKVNRVLIKENEKEATVIVDEDQLSLAIGREGQNVRLAARLTGWKIDIKGQDSFNEEDYLDYEGPENNDSTELDDLFAIPENYIGAEND